MGTLKKLFKWLGPGFVTGASDDDPSGIATYAQAGAQFGYQQLWMAFLVFPFMAIVQEMCGRIGMVTGKGLSGVIRLHYPRIILYIAVMLLLGANIMNIGADLGAMASSLSHLVGGSFMGWLAGFTILSLLLQIFIPYKRYANYLKYLAFSLLAYVLTAFLVHVDWRRALTDTVIPHISFEPAYIMNLVAVLGTTISPYLFFWQASEEVEEAVEQGKIPGIGMGRPKVGNREVINMQWDTGLGMFFSNLVMFFIILTTAATLNQHHIHQIETATQAAEALRPLAGNWAFLLFSIGIISTGLLGVPVLAGSCAYAVSEAWNWKSGLYKKFDEATGFYSIIIVAMIVGMMINISGIPPFKLLYYTAILNGLCAPPLMIVILFISTNKKIMRRHVNQPLTTWSGILITGVMSVCALLLLLDLLHLY